MQEPHKSTKAKCKALHVGTERTLWRHRLGSSCAERDPGQQAQREPATCHGSRSGKHHPGLCQQERSQQMEAGNYPSALNSC